MEALRDGGMRVGRVSQADHFHFPSESSSDFGGAGAAMPCCCCLGEARPAVGPAGRATPCVPVTFARTHSYTALSPRSTETLVRPQAPDGPVSSAPKRAPCACHGTIPHAGPQPAGRCTPTRGPAAATRHAQAAEHCRRMVCGEGTMEGHVRHMRARPSALGDAFHAPVRAVHQEPYH